MKKMKRDFWLVYKCGHLQYVGFIVKIEVVYGLYYSKFFLVVQVISNK